MFRLVVNALRARRTQTVAIFALTVLAALGGSAAPWFMAWAHEAVAAADIQAAPTKQRIVVVKGSARYRAGDPSPVDAFRDVVSGQLDIAGGTVTIGAQLFANAAKKADTPDSPVASGLYLSSRAGVCQQVQLEGRCPDQPGEVMIGRATAVAVGVAVGDRLTIEAFRIRTAQTLRVSGIYDVKDVLSPYWAGTDLLTGPAGVVATKVDEAAFVSEATLMGLPIDAVDLDYHLELPASAFAGSGNALEALLRDSVAGMRGDNLELTTTAYQLIAQIRSDQRLVATGVQVAALELILLSWFALYLAVRQTSDARRPDIGLLKLRGAARWRIWTLTAEQSAIPMLLGVVVGGGLGYLSAAVLAGDSAALRPTGPGGLSATLLTSVLVALGVGVGSLLAAIAAEWRVLRSPVADLLRRVPTRRSGWRGNIGDFVIVALAVAGTYQGYAERDNATGPSTLSLVAPGLVGLAVALLTARLLPWLAGKSGGAAMRSGRAGAALSAFNVARRPGTDRVFTVLAVCVGVVATSVFTWHAADQAWTDRAELELGAPRVLVVQAANSTQLLSAVRAADPEGRFAMAVAVNVGASVEDRTLAVDSARFTSVAYLPDRYGVTDLGGLATALHPARPSLARVQDGTMTLTVSDATPTRAATGVPSAPGATGTPGASGTSDATGDVEPKPLSVRLILESADGLWHTTMVGPVRSGKHPYDATVAGCGAGGCRLVGFELVSERRPAGFTLHELSQGGTAIVTPAVFGDVTRWRAPVGSASIGPVLAASADSLTVAKYDGGQRPGQRLDPRVLVADSPAPLPMLRSGDRPSSVRPGDSRFITLGTESVPYHDVGTARVLPRLGANGAVMDLEYASRVAARADEVTSLEVWLAADAPTAIIDDLRRGGVVVLTDTTVDDVRAGFAAHGPGVATRFQLFAALVLLLLAAGAIVVSATVERRERAQELRNLRTQGLPERSMRFAGYAATLLVAGGAILAGLVAAVLAQELVTVSLPIFTDGWSLLPRETGVTGTAFGIAVLATVVVLLPAAIAGSARVVGSVHSSRGGDVE